MKIKVLLSGRIPAPRWGAIKVPRKEECGKLKYLVNREFRPEDMEKVLNKFGEYLKDHEKNPGKYPEYLWPCHVFAGQSKGFSLVETTPDQINNEIIYWNPLLKLKFNPIIKVSKLVEQFMKSK